MTDRISQIRTFLEDDPDDAFLLFALATELSNTGQSEEALEVFYKLRSVHPDYVGLYYHLGQLEEACQHSDRAEQTYLAGIKMAELKGDLHARSELEGVLNLLRDRE